LRWLHAWAATQQGGRSTFPVRERMAWRPACTIKLRCIAQLLNTSTAGPTSSINYSVWYTCLYGWMPWPVVQYACARVRLGVWRVTDTVRCMVLPCYVAVRWEWGLRTQLHPAGGEHLLVVA